MKKHFRKFMIFVLFISLMFFVGVYLLQTEQWSIGIYRGASPLTLNDGGLSNPVITPDHVTDTQAITVADPFMVNEASQWYMFFEVLNHSTDQGDIALATSACGLKWHYEHIVLDEPFHLSYPHVFKWDGHFYMTPESRQAMELRLYRASSFPHKWEFIGTLLKGTFADPSLFWYGDKWWIFTETNPGAHDTLRLFYASALTGPYIEHPKSPIVAGDPERARPGGRVLLWEDKILRFAQDCTPIYGNKVRAFQITRLNPIEYQEKELPMNPGLRAGGRGWRATGMHHCDAYSLGTDRWLACVDGRSGGITGFLMKLRILRLKDTH